MREIVFIISVLLVFSCQNNKEKQGVNTVTSIINTDSEPARKWLEKSLEEYFNSENPDMKSICTLSYYERKTDATNIELDPGMSLKEFKKKWEENYNIEFIGIGDGFLIPTRDYGEIKLLKCTFKSKTEKGYYIFETILEDLDFKAKYKRDIIVMPVENRFEIEDIWEYQ